MVSTEIWKWIDGYEGEYQISNYGRLKSYRKDKSGKIMSNINKNGWYFTVNLIDNKGKRKTERIHRLVARTFIGDIPKGYHVHHKDGNKQNNKVDNLEIIHPAKHHSETIRMNKNILEGMNNYNRYEKTKRICQFSEDGVLLATYVNGEVASRMTGICQRNILQVASKTPFNSKGSVRKQAGGYIWKYESEVM